MKRVLSVCPKCGAEIPADATRGACPACLLRAGLGLFLDESVAGGNGGSARRGETINAFSLPAEASAKAGERVPPQWTKILADFGDYELLEEIGRGGQGVVYRARQKSLNRTVALKVIGLGHWATESHLKRFRREAEAAASLEHPGIVPIHEVGERDGSCYFSMKFVEGGQLDEVVQHTPMSIRKAAELIAKVARTVHYAHEHGILHRDIKPGNILLDGSGEPHLTDFGLARLVETESTVTRTKEVLGTPSYMAPEQAVGETGKLTSATDVYGLGAVLYQLLTGQPPFAGGTTYETIRLLLDKEPRPPRLLNPKVDRDLSTICLKCLEKDPEQRYSTALALAEDLERWLKHEPIQAKPSGFVTHTRKWVRRNPSTAMLVTLLLALAVGLNVTVWNRKPKAVIPKSVAVLPFENLSSDSDNAYFVDGMQDEILTDLARIADLKVIGRTSAMQYKSGVERDLRRIGEELGVAHIVEGSVQRSSNRVRVNAQLLETRTGTLVWAERYDEDLNDLFAVQSEIAREIAKQLHAEISAAEKQAIGRPPTTDLTAFDLYTRARNLLLATNFGSSTQVNFREAADLLNQAVVRDPSFFQAYCELAHAHDRLYFLGVDHTPARLALAEAAIDVASRLSPRAGETHRARAENLFCGYLDYDGALAELEAARQTLPNDPRIFQLKAGIERGQGRWGQSVRSYEGAIELDPRSVGTLKDLGETYHLLRLYPKAMSILDRVLDIEPKDIETNLLRAFEVAHWKAQTGPLHQLIDSLRASHPASNPDTAIADLWIYCVLLERDAGAAEMALTALGERSVNYEGVNLSPSFLEGLIARMTNDDVRARRAFTRARAEQEKLVRAEAMYAPPLCVLGLIDAALGRKEEALREGRRAVELLPVQKDAIKGAHMIQFFSMIAAWVGDKDLACEQLANAMRYPSLLSYGELKLLPWWDPLRGDPRFEKLVEESKEPVAIN
jgi:serine/threonine protein kinase/Tfp pilus assembly protein PilF